MPSTVDMKDMVETTVEDMVETRVADMGETLVKADMEETLAMVAMKVVDTGEGVATMAVVVRATMEMAAEGAALMLVKLSMLKPKPNLKTNAIII